MPNPHTLHQIPLTEIHATALTRDREGLDPEPLRELRLSIAANGLRQPIEVYALPEPVEKNGHPRRYGLISGLRRLMAFEENHDLTGDPRYATIPAFLRPRGTLAEALATMVEENEIRAGLSPWERGRIAWLAQRQEIFPTIEEAVLRLYPMASRMKRARLSAVAQVVEEFNGVLTNPETLSLRQCLRIATALQAGFGEVIHTALEESKPDNPQAQWKLLAPILTEAETPLPETPKPRPGCPRRVARPRPGLTIRREQTRDGWCLHFTGREATSWMLDDVFGDIERMYGPG
jgi:ParB family chromosome partitioning protein